MPQTTVVFYRDDDGTVPVRDWLDGLRRRDRAAAESCVKRITHLAALGHELRRPAADYLRDGIYELRMRVARVNYRILYFFHGTVAAVLAHGLTKEGEVPDADIERAIRRKARFQADPKTHTG